MLEIRISNYKADGSETKTTWSVDPLKDKSHPRLERSEGSSTGGVLRRRPYFEQTVRQITFGADVLLDAVRKENFIRLLRSHKIEFVTTEGRKKIYTEYSIDTDAEIEYEYLEDIVDLAFKELKFIETKPRWFNQWYAK